MLKVGLVGVGHLGKIHLRLLKELKCYNVVGFYDADPVTTNQVSNEFGVKGFKSLDALLSRVDVVDIVAPTKLHFEIAQQAVKAGKHIFIEKPLCSSTSEAKQLIRLIQEAQVKAMVGHVERFNPAFLAIKDVNIAPRFMETHRLAQFNPRGTDVSVVLDLMIHDLDIILSLVKSNVKHVHASGVSLISDSPDIANARIEFDNGCVANITASRISMKQMRKMRIFQSDAYISMDFVEKKTEIIQLKDKELGIDEIEGIELNTPKGKKVLKMTLPKIEENNAIKMELEEFANAIKNDTEPPVTVYDGFKAMELADLIIEKIERNNSF